MDTRSAIQVRLQLDDDSWHGAKSECIWTRLVKKFADKAIVEVDNVPFFTKCFSLYDKLALIFSQNGPIIDGVFERGGHSTYRIFIENHNIKASRMLDKIKSMGCGLETTNFKGGKLYAVDVPPKVDIYEVYGIFEKGKTKGAWLFEEGYVGHPLEGNPAPKCPGVRRTV